jgi:hypothetical protein
VVKSVFQSYNLVWISVNKLIFASPIFPLFYFMPLDLRNSCVLRGFDPLELSPPPVSSRVWGLVLLHFLSSAIDFVL